MRAMNLINMDEEGQRAAGHIDWRAERYLCLYLLLVLFNGIFWCLVTNIPAVPVTGFSSINRRLTLDCHHRIFAANRPIISKDCVFLVHLSVSKHDERLLAFDDGDTGGLSRHGIVGDHG